MMWAKPKESRDQIVLFAEKLDDAIPPDHCVRLLACLLDKVDWSAWESVYDLTKGQPPIHPKILAGVILHGLLKRIRTSRGLEEALTVRMDFRWLAEGRTIDHSTIAKFRTAHDELLADLFVQIGLIAQQMGHLTLVTLGYDGTRMRASNRNTGTRTPEELRNAKQQLAAEFQTHREAIEKAQTSEDEIFDAAKAAELASKSESLQRASDRVEAALAEIAAIEASGKKVPARLPITDPQCRIAPNKEGGFAANYNPTVTVDVDSGLIAACDVISGLDEQSHMHEAIDEVRRDFLQGDTEQRVEMLADGLMATGENIAACEAKNVDFYSPAGPENPAYRENPSEPVAAEKLGDLPVRGKRPKKGEEDNRRFAKSAFLYDPEADLYYCPMGKTLERKVERNSEPGQERFIYRAEKSECAGCPLRAKCFKDRHNKYGRQIESGTHETATQAHAAKMQDDESSEKYSRRAAATERPFAVIKHGFGVRSFLVRGLRKVRAEWRLLCIAHNLHRLFSLIAQGRARETVP
jgi:transposase